MAKLGIYKRTSIYNIQHATSIALINMHRTNTGNESDTYPYKYPQDSQDGF